MFIIIDNQNIPPGCIVCAWCAKIGMKLFTLRTATGCKAFCRRASFKKNKICDWCKHVRHTVNYVDFQDGEQQLQFCSNKCLNQYKMNIFCNETKAHLHLSPTMMKDTTKLAPVSSKQSSNLITPELWLKDLKNGENESNSANSFIETSDSELDLDLEDSQPLPPLPLKRRFTELSKDTDLKSSEKPKDNSVKDKIQSPKDSKRAKHSHKLPNSNRQISGAKPIDKSSANFHSPSYVGHARHSPIPTSVASLPRSSMVA
ncbi:unnamed protein product, partial [Oppiella nova]